MATNKLLGVRRFGAGWESVVDHPENETVTVLRNAPKKSNVYIKTQDDSGFLRAPPEPRKFDPDELEPPRRAPAPMRRPPPKVTSKAIVPSKKPGRDKERHREYMRKYMAKRRAESKLTP